MWCLVKKDGCLGREKEKGRMTRVLMLDKAQAKMTEDD